MSNKTPKNPPICFFNLFLIVLLKPFINKHKSSRDLTISIISYISSSEIIKAVSDPNTFFLIAASVTDVAAVKVPQYVRLAKGVNIFFY